MLIPWPSFHLKHTGYVFMSYFISRETEGHLSHAHTLKGLWFFFWMQWATITLAHAHTHTPHQLSAFVCRGSYHAAALQEGAEGFWGTMHRHLTSLAWPCVSTPFGPCVRRHCHLHPYTEIDCSFSTDSKRDSQTEQPCF